MSILKREKRNDIANDAGQVEGVAVTRDAGMSG
jgi:hypothetical protein